MITLFESGLSIVLTQKLAEAYGRKDYEGFARLAASGVVLAGFLGSVVPW